MHAFFKYAFLFVMIRSMQEGDPLKQVGFFIRCSKLMESAKSCKFLSCGVILKSPNNIACLHVSKYMDRLLDKLSKNTDLLCSGCLYAPTITCCSNGGLFLEKEFHYHLCGDLVVLQECSN